MNARSCLPPSIAARPRTCREDLDRRAIKKATGSGGGKLTTRFAYGLRSPAGVRVIVEVLTDTAIAPPAKGCSIFHQEAACDLVRGNRARCPFMFPIILGVVEYDAKGGSASHAGGPASRAGAEDFVRCDGGTKILHKPRISWPRRQALEAKFVRGEPRKTALTWNRRIPLRSYDEAGRDRGQADSKEASTGQDTCRTFYANFEIFRRRCATS